MTTKFSGIGVNTDFNMKAFHDEMQKERRAGKDCTLKSFLADTYDSNYTPESFYRDLGIDPKGMTVEKMLNTGDLTRWLFPEVFRDAIRRGLEYTPFYTQLITGEEPIPSTGVTMPSLNMPPADEVRLRDVHEGGTIPEGELYIWAEKQVTIKKQARGLKQTYESIAFTPIDLAAIYFEELGARLGADLDRALITIAINGDQASGSEAAPVIGAATSGVLAYTDIARTWIRMKRINRNSSAMLMSEPDAITVLNMAQFIKNQFPGGVSISGVTLNVNTPLPTDQDIYVHDAMPIGDIVFVDRSRAFVQLTALPLLIESEKIVSRQLNGEYVSIITGFANIFTNGRVMLNYNTTLVANPGPVVQS